MAQNLRINPQTRDYVLDQGSPIPSDRVLEQAYYALTIPAGQWLHGEPGQGSELYRLVGVKRSAQTERLFSVYARDAIERQLIDPGKARSVTISNVDRTSNGTSNQIDIEPELTSISTILNFKAV